MVCKGFNKKGQPCGTKYGLSPTGFCRWHNTCLGRDNTCLGRRSDGTKCNGPRKHNYDYCCAAHDPTLYYVSPSLFGKDNLRGEMLNVVLNYRDERDLYNGEKLRVTNLRGHQVDHILEKQCYAFATVQAGITEASDQLWVAEIIRDDIANRSENLCITRTYTNVMKGQACFKFLDDFTTGHRNFGDIRCTFDTYLQRETQDGERLQRNTTRQIRKAMGTSLKFSQRKLSGEGDSPELARISVELQSMYVDMDLKVSAA